jgi:ribonuclease BN (tRNA processing enzyme)
MKAWPWAVAVWCGLAAAAVAAETPATSSVTKLILLGTQGGPRISLERAEPANLLVVKGKPYLVDAGNGVARQLASVHFAPADIHEIFVTHNHDDHNADWGTLMGLAWTNGNTKPTTVYGPPGTQSMLKGYLQYFAPNVASHWMESSRVPAENIMKAKDIAGSGLVYEDDNIRVTAVENCHYHFDKGTPGYGWQKSFAFRFQTPDKVVVFSGDTGQCGHAMSDFAKGADILVHEVIDLAAIERTLHTTSSDPGQLDRLMNHMRTEHSTAEQVGQVAHDAGVKLVVLSHLVNGGAPANEAAYIAGVKSHYSGPVVVGKDLMEF